MAINRDTLENNRPETAIAHTMLLDPTVAKVLDFDDTVAKTSVFQRRSVEVAAHALGIPVSLSPEFGANHLRGKSGREIMEIVLREFANISDPTIIDQAVALRNEALIELANKAEYASQLLHPGISQIVRLLRQTKQQVAIATQSPEPFVRAFLGNVDVDGKPITDVFDPRLVIGSELISRAEERFSTRRKNTSFAKPHPISMSHAGNKVVRDHKTVLYIGDSEIDARTVAGVDNVVGIIVNHDPAKREALRREFDMYNNITVISSLEEIAYE